MYNTTSKHFKHNNNLYVDTTQNNILKSHCGVYQIRNKLNGMVYVGSTLNLYKRRMQHRRRLNSGTHGNSYLQRAWNKYGENAFIFEVLQFLPNDENTLRSVETYYIQTLQACDKSKGYNLMYDACRNLIPEESRLKISEKAKGNKNWLGKRHTQETKDLLSKLHTGKIVSQSTRDKLSKINKGIPKWTEEQKKQMSLVRQGTNCGKDNPMYGRVGSLNPFYGKKHSQETKNKISQGRLGGNNPAATPIKCLETGEVYASLVDYRRQHAKGEQCTRKISKCCRGLIPDVNGYHWVYISKEEL